MAARAVAKEVLETIGSGKKPSLRKIARKHGYAPTSADNPKQITETKSYQEVMKPLVQRLEDERNAIMAALEEKRPKAQYHQLIDGLDKVTKNIQLLTGGATENMKVIAAVEVSFK